MVPIERRQRATWLLVFRGSVTGQPEPAISTFGVPTTVTFAGNAVMVSTADVRLIFLMGTVPVLVTLPVTTSVFPVRTQLGIAVVDAGTEAFIARVPTSS